MSKQQTWEKSIIGLLLIAMIIIGFNVYQITMVKAEMHSVQLNTNAKDTTGMSQDMPTELDLSGPEVIPPGVPEIYGKELGISYDDVSAKDPKKADSTINKLGLLDQKITLKGDGLKRYIIIASQMSCEYCCGAESIIFKNGQAACGCAHSFAMRGLAKYLITNHGNEYTDEQILEEMGKWKTLFFPGKITQKARVLQDKGIALIYVNLASNKYRGIENQV